MANFLSNILHASSPDAKAAQLVHDRIKLTQSRYSGMNNRMRELNRYYLSLSPPVENRDNDRPTNTRSRDDEDYFVQISFSIVESATPHWLFAQFGSRPWVQVWGNTQDDHDKAPGVEKMLDYDLDRSNVFMQSIPVGKCVFKYGTGIFKVGWRFQGYEARVKRQRKEPTGFNFLGELMSDWKAAYEKVPIVEFDGPWLEWVSNYNFGVDPLYNTMDSFRFVWERRWTDRQTLKKENEMYRLVNDGKDLYKNIDKIPPFRRGGIEDIYELDAGSDDTSEAMGWNPTNFRTGRYVSIGAAEEDRDSAIEIIQYWEDDRVVEMANGEVVIRDAGGDQFPYTFKEKPYGMVPCITLENSPYGMGLLQPIKGSQEAWNSWRNLITRQARLNTLNVWAWDEDTGDPGVSMADLDPGDGVQIPFYANGKPSVVPLFPPRALPPEAWNFEAIFKSDIQRAIAFGDMMFGQSTGSGSDTATEIKAMTQGQSSRIRLFSQIGELTYLQKVAKFFLRRRQQFSEEETIFRIVGEQAPKTIEFLKMSVEDMWGEFDFKTLGPQLRPNEDVIRQQMLQGLALIKGDPLFASISDVYEIWRELWKLFDPRYGEKFVIPPPLKVMSAQQENIILNAGEYVRVTPNEPHDEHIPSHVQAAASAQTDEARQRFQEHLEEHEKFSKGKQGSPPEQQPGLRGHQGNVPNMKRANESQAGIQARVSGGSGV